MIRGEVTWLYAFDIAHDMRRGRLKTVLGCPVEPWVQAQDHRVPRQSFFHRPQVVRLPAVAVCLREGREAWAERTLKILPVGGISIAFTVEVEVEQLGDLVGWHEAPEACGSEAVRRLAQEVVEDLREALIQPLEALEDEEAYTVFRLDPPEEGDAEGWLERNRREVAALLTQEEDAQRLCEREVEETVSRSIGYYRDDLVVVDWDAALVVDRRGPAADVVGVLELANLQLCELEAYDRILDRAVESSYEDLARRKKRPHGTLRRLSELRVDLSRLSDELTHAGKFLGDWHLARVYDVVAARFHLADWQRVVEGKLRTLDDLYQVLKHDQSNRAMLLMELIVVLILVFEAGTVLVPMLRK
ncbi:MAG: hypothetical protein RLZZ142_1569 [Verrucomicrobiota bacterium]